MYSFLRPFSLDFSLHGIVRGLMLGLVVSIVHDTDRMEKVFLSSSFPQAQIAIMQASPDIRRSRRSHTADRNKYDIGFHLSRS